MHHDLHKHWLGVLKSRGDSTALIDAESGKSLSFREIDAQADAWLAEHPQLQDADGGIWCLALSDRADWLKVFLAAIRVGAVVLPVEAEAHPVQKRRAEALGASHLIDSAGLHTFPEGTVHKGYFLIKLTSGTTGEPKPLLFTEAEMMADGGQIMGSMSISAADRTFTVIPLGHSYGLGNVVMPFFMAGVPMVLGSSPYPQVMLEELNRYPCTVLPLVPPLVKALSAVCAEPGRASGLRLVISAGSALKPTIALRFHQVLGIPVHNFYGSSETGGICFDRSGQLAASSGAVGTPLEGVDVSLAEDGAIRVRSAALCHALYPEGVASSHDFGQWDERGALRLTGRHADIVKVAGRRIALSEIEAALCALEDVSDAYVTVREGRSGENRSVALFSGGAEVEAVRRRLAAQLPDWKLPKVLRKVDHIGYTARGKKDRKALEQSIDALISR